MGGLSVREQRRLVPVLLVEDEDVWIVGRAGGVIGDARGLVACDRLGHLTQGGRDHITAPRFRVVPGQQRPRLAATLHGYTSVVDRWMLWSSRRPGSPSMNRRSTKMLIAAANDAIAAATHTAVNEYACARNPRPAGPMMAPTKAPVWVTPTAGPGALGLSRTIARL